MNRNRKNGFTLIELIAVLVILAIIALIVTPLVMNIVKKAKDSANKRSVDAYGKAVELGVATYLLDNGDYPTDISSLTIEYSGSEVVCTTKKLNEDGSIYLSGCSVNGSVVKDSKNEDGFYHYGKNTDIQSEPIVYQAYNIGDMVTYNGMNFYVIEASDETKDSVTLLKEEPLTTEEVNTYGVGHVNMYVTGTSSDYYQKANDVNGYGGMAYYSSETCGYNGSDNCITDYSASEIKYVVDAWTNAKLTASDLKEDSLGYKARLLTIEELTNNFGYENADEFDRFAPSTEDTPLWLYNSRYEYWTMSESDFSTTYVYYVGDTGFISRERVNYYYASFREALVVRPVITLSKDAI